MGIGGISKGEFIFFVALILLLLLGTKTVFEFAIDLLTQDVFCQPTGGNPR